MSDPPLEPDLEAIAVRRYGTAGPEVAVLHGGPGAPGSVSSLAELLAAHFRVAEPFQRRAGVAPLTVERHVEDLAAVLPAPVSVVGHSWGAMLGLSFTALHPELVISLVLVGCGTYDASSRDCYRAAMEARLDAGTRAELAVLDRRMARAVDVAARDEVLAERGRIALRLQSVDLIDDRTVDVPADSAGHEETWADVLRLQVEGVEPQRFDGIRSPVLMVHGDADPHPGVATRDVLLRHVPHLEYLELPACGHAPWLEREARAPFLRAVTDWLLAHDRGVR